METVKDKILKIVAVLMLIIIAFVVCVVNYVNKERDVLIFLSDYQDLQEINMMKHKNLEIILKNIKKDYSNIDTIAFLGDYQNWPLKEGKSNLGIMEAKNITYNVFGSVDTMFIAGNHDYIDFYSDPSYYTDSGLYEYDKYSLYLINFVDYFDISTTVDNLKNSLEVVNSDKPLIILGHVPLHDSGRGDNDYSFYIFDLINEYAINNDVVYLFGHNHSYGYDNDIGGSIVYKPIGDNIKIKYSDENIEYKKLNFTYMNAGYIGYYNEEVRSDLTFPEASDYDTTETASVFKIYDNKIEMIRYSKNGVYKKYEIKLRK